MSGIKSILADTNILIYYLEGRHQLSSYIDHNFLISIITEVEFWGVKHIPGISLKKRESLVKDTIVLQFDETIKNIAINIKQLTALKTPDAIIAATAIKYQLPLLTADKAFHKVRDLDLLLLEL